MNRRNFLTSLTASIFAFLFGVKEASASTHAPTGKRIVKWTLRKRDIFDITPNFKPFGLIIEYKNEYEPTEDGSFAVTKTGVPDGWRTIKSDRLVSDSSGRYGFLLNGALRSGKPEQLRITDRGNAYFFDDEEMSRFHLVTEDVTACEAFVRLYNAGKLKREKS